MTDYTDQTAPLLAAIVESSDDAIVSKDLDGIVRSWNRAAERMFGFTADEIVGQSIRRILPDDRQQEEDQVLASIRAGQRVDHFETVRRTRNGALIPISLTVSPIFDASGRVVGASKIARDISDRKRAAAQADRVARRDAFLAQVTLTLTHWLGYQPTLRALASLAVPGIADYCAVDVLNEMGELETIAVAYEGSLRAQFAEEVRARFEDPASPSSRRRVVLSGVPSFIPQITDNMSIGLVSYICVPMTAHAKTLGVLTLASAESRTPYTDSDLRLAEDVASRAALAIENAQAYEQVQAANRLKDEFLATLSHELRTPLNAVLGYVRMLQSGAIAREHTPRALEVIERNAGSLAQIVEDVLDVSRIISGKVRLDLRPTDIASAVKDAIATVTPAAESKGVRLERAIHSDLGPISADPNRLQQVLWNLLSNAVKFTPRGGEVQIRVGQVDSYAEIVVSDSGVGFSADFLPHMFERFRQADSGTARRYGGLGLGLAIARHIVEMHGGTIDGSSAGEGKGATFRVRLPLAMAQPWVHDKSPAGQYDNSKRALEQAIDLDGVRVMAVDDDADALELMREILESAGATVIIATSAGAALDQLLSDRPQVLVTDLGMPTMDGFQLIERIRQMADASLRRIPAAALTAYARSDDRARALSSGFEMHLAKPIDPGELVAAVGALARR